VGEVPVEVRSAAEVLLTQALGVWVTSENWSMTG